jgi:hypothetical protein
MTASVGICYAYSPNGYYRTQWLCNVTGFRPTLAFERDLPAGVANPDGIIAVRTAADLPTDHELVVMSPMTARLVLPSVSLDAFEHPERAIYFFGPDTTFLSGDDLGGRSPDHIVCVPVASERANDELYSFVVAAIVLYDRMKRRPWLTKS